MDKAFLEGQKEKLEKSRNELRGQLETFATEDPKLTGDWDTKFPKRDGGTGSSALEDATDEVEEYVTKLPVEHSLELRLKEVNLALEKIKTGKYGKCERCKKDIPRARMEACLEARLCMKCQK